MPSETSLCFLEAFQAKESGKITQSHYLDYLLAHLQGTEHEEDDKDVCEPWIWESRMSGLTRCDPFGYSIRLWSVNTDPIKGT
jgi:hypothetical protein